MTNYSLDKYLQAYWEIYILNSSELTYNPRQSILRCNFRNLVKEGFYGKFIDDISQLPMLNFEISLYFCTSHLSSCILRHLATRMVIIAFSFW